ncbi:SCO family protein [Flavobacteriaceae bacterium 3-367]|uniref:SCO family protein n=1 Tax=Eudoraea algarum TaxID=3417568 RepID=UPI00328EB3A5
MGFMNNTTISKELIFFVSLIAIVAVHKMVITEKQPPIYQPADLNPELVDGSMQQLKENHRVSNFSLINQLGERITHQDYEGKIYVTDFFFTRCPSICPIMTSNMAKLQERFMDVEAVRLLSISVTPEMDSVPVLQNYAERHGAVASKWNIATGDKKHIYTLARKSYFAVMEEGDGALQDFIHTPNFVLVDSEKQIRGIYDGTKEVEIRRLIKDIELLLD